MKNLTTLLGTSMLTAGIISLSAMDASAATLLGTFDGNDTGNKGTALTNLNTLAGPADWQLEGKSDEGFGSFLSGGTDTQTGTWSTGLTGAGAFSVKAATGYTLYLTDDISVIDWTTAGLSNRGGNQPNLSHLSLYVRPTSNSNGPTVPEPTAVLASFVGLAAVGVMKKKA